MTIPKTNLERLENIAFWHWQYQRRNLLYQKYCDVWFYYLNKFDEIGEYEYLHTEDFGKDCLTLSKGLLWDEIPFVARVIEKTGDEKATLLFRLLAVGSGFNKKFCRMFKHWSYGEGSYDIINILLKTGEFDFKTTNIIDIMAVLTDYQFSLKCEGQNVNIPGIKHGLKHDLDLSSIDVESLPDITMEAKLIKLMQQSLKFGPDDEPYEFTDQDLEELYELVYQGKYKRPANEMRLVALWIWDVVHDVDVGPPMDFDLAYKRLKALVKKSNYASIFPASFFHDRRRVREYYENTHESILKSSVLASSKK